MKYLLVLWMTWATASVALAAPRSSSSYSISTDTTDGGGKRATSTSYTNDGSAGGMAGISTVAAPPEAVKAGYVGQLYEVTGLTVTSATPSVNENATLQLGAWQVLDDVSYLAVAANGVNWSVLSGPISGISSGGLATAGTVYQNTAVMVQGGYGGFTGSLSLTVLNVNNDDLGSYAGDGVADDWQAQYFGLDNPDAAPTADASHTGQTNLLKYVAGLDPTDPNSRFVVAADPTTTQPGHRDIVISPRYPDRNYIVESGTDFSSWDVVTGPVVDNGTVRTVTDLNAGTEKFYRVRIVKP